MCTTARRFLLLLLFVGLLFACQHQRPAEDSATLGATGKGGVCEEPQFEMKYLLGEVMPVYIDLGVELERTEGDFLANFGRDTTYETEIRVTKREDGLLATISTHQATGMKKQAEGLIVNRYGVEDPFMLVIENGAEDGDPLAITVKAREMSEHKNSGIIKGKGVTALMLIENPEYLQVSSHHRGLIVTEGGKVKERYFMKNGLYRGKTITPLKFQDVAEDYLFCIGKLEQGESGKGDESELKSVISK